MVGTARFELALSTPPVWRLRPSWATSRQVLRSPTLAQRLARDETAARRRRPRQVPRLGEPSPSCGERRWRLRRPLVLTSAMPVEGEYEPSPSDWVREQVELYESSGGTRGTTLRNTG